MFGRSIWADMIDVNVVLDGDSRLSDGFRSAGAVVRNCDLAARHRVHAGVLEGVPPPAPATSAFAACGGAVLATGCRIRISSDKNARLAKGKGQPPELPGRHGNQRQGEHWRGCHLQLRQRNKHRTVIEDGSSSAPTALVAPVTVTAATIGAGSTISKDAPSDALTVSRSRQTTVKGWKRPVKKES
jgi:bifunctional UDP-N-acetylglucosamine pyrophosphorylase/glucosamine-1-phosphate N-acetyltransferase